MLNNIRTFIKKLSGVKNDNEEVEFYWDNIGTYIKKPFGVKNDNEVEIYRYEADNGIKSSLYRDLRGYFLEESLQNDADYVICYPIAPGEAYHWINEKNNSLSILIAEFMDEDPDYIEMIESEKNLTEITGRSKGIFLTPDMEDGVFMQWPDEKGVFPEKDKKTNLWEVKKKSDSYEVTEKKTFKDLADILPDNLKNKQLFKVILSKPGKFAGTIYHINGYSVIAMDRYL